MTDDEFWDIIRKSRATLSAKPRDGNMVRQAAALRGILIQLPDSDIIQFRDKLVARMDQAFTYELWAAAHVVARGCSDDGFRDFRSWLISMGRDAFERALSNPETLVGPASAPEVEDVFFEGLPAVVEEAYRSKTGRQIPEPISPRPRSPRGVKWSDDAALERRFPELWRRSRGRG